MSSWAWSTTLLAMSPPTLFNLVSRSIWEGMQHPFCRPFVGLWRRHSARSWNFALFKIRLIASTPASVLGLRTLHVFFVKGKVYVNPCDLTCNASRKCKYCSEAPGSGYAWVQYMHVPSAFILQWEGPSTSSIARRLSLSMQFKTSVKRQASPKKLSFRVPAWQSRLLSQVDNLDAGCNRYFGSGVACGIWPLTWTLLAVCLQVYSCWRNMLVWEVAGHTSSCFT